MMYRVVARNLVGIIVQESDLHSREDLPEICADYAARDDVASLQIVGDDQPGYFESRSC